MDGIGGTIKNKVLDVKSGKVHIKEIKSLGEYADLAINKIKSLHLQVNDVLEEPDDIDYAPKIPSTLEVHQVKRECNVAGVCKLQFFKAASDSLPFHEEFCRRYGDPEVYDYPLLPPFIQP